MNNDWLAVEEIKKAISRAPTSIEEEFNKQNGNSWLACFTSSIFQIECYLSTRGALSELGAERHKVVDQKLESLKKRCWDLKKLYPDRDTIPPNDIKKELFILLDIMK